MLRPLTNLYPARTKLWYLSGEMRTSYYPLKEKPGRYVFARPLRSGLLGFACLLVALLPALLRAQTTIHVPADQLTIQAGINAANNGDTVLVAPGTYYENIDFKGKAITVISSAGAATTILDGSKGNTSGVLFTHGESRQSVLSGFTIQGGGVEPWDGSSAGIQMQGSQPTIVNNVITHNHCYTIWVGLSSPLIQNNNINNTLDNKGDCASGGGAGIYLSGSAEDGSGHQIPIIISGNTIEDNTQSGQEDAGANGGAGISIWGGNPIIENNIIRNNVTLGGGGAINIASYDPTGNTILIVQNLIYGNQAADGGAIAFDAFRYLVDIYIANNTIVDNTPNQINAALAGQDGPNVAFVNNILAGNISNPSIQCNWQVNPPIVPDEQIQPIFDHNLFLNKGGPVFDSTCVDVSAKYGNIAADPLFANWSGQDYHIQSGSPAIDAGNTSVLQSLNDAALNLTTDYDGNPRVADATSLGYPIIDMGAYEYAGVQDTQPTTIVLTPSEFYVQGGTTLTLTAQLASAAGTPTGSVAFLEDGNQIGTGAIDENGQALLVAPPLVPGTHSFIAKFPAPGPTTSTLPPATSVVAIVVSQATSSSLTLASTPNPSQIGGNVTFTVNLSAPGGIPTGQVSLTNTTTNTTLATLTPDSKGNATFTTSSLVAGANWIEATYAGDSNYAGASAEIEQVVGALYPAALEPLSSQSPSTVGQGVTFTAIVTSTYKTPTGSVNFLDGTTLMGTSPLVNGTATFTTSSLTAGQHTIWMDYPPNSTWFGVNEPLTQAVTGLPTATTLAASPNPAYALQPVTLTAKVTSTASGTPTGTMTFSNGGAMIGTAPVQANGVAALQTSFPSASATPLQLTASYGGDASFNSSTSAPLPETITFNHATPVVTSIVPNPVESFGTATFTATVSSTTAGGNAPTGTISFTAYGKIMGTGTLANGTVSIPIVASTPGHYSVVADYSGDAAFSPSISLPKSFTVAEDVVDVTPSSSENPSVYGDYVTFTAVVSLASTTPPGPSITGSVIFFDGETRISPAVPLDSNASAQFTLNTLVPDKHSITAVYSGNDDIGRTTSSVLIQEVTPYLGDFQLHFDPLRQIVYQGEAAKFTVSITPLNGFSLPVKLSCYDLPANTVCDFSPTILSNGKLSSTLYVKTSAGTTATTTTTARRTRGVKGLAGGAAALAFAFGLLIVPRRWRRGLWVRSILIGAILLGIFTSLSACGGGGTLNGITPAGTYGMAIKAETDVNVPSFSHAGKVTLVVKSLF